MTSVSVVVPTHHRPELLRRAVQSIIDQDWCGPIEILVVFDQAEPHELPVETTRDRTIRVLRNDDRSPGLPGARNTGILASTGTWLGFCDDDDSWLPGKLTAQLRRLEEYGAPAICAVGNLIETGVAVHERPVPADVLDYLDFVRSRVMEVHPGSMLMSRDDVLERIGLFDEAVPYGYGEDYDFVLRAARHRPVIAVDECLVRISYHPGSYYAGSWAKTIAGLEYLVSKHPELSGDRKGSARIDGQLAVAYGALGERGRAARLALGSLRRNPSERRALVGLAVAAGVPADGVVALIRSRGRGI